MARLTLPYPDKDFVPLNVLNAQDLDEMAANDKAIADFVNGLASGTNFDNGAIKSEKLSKTGFGNFSLSEANTGFVWIDNKPIWKKTISVGQLPNNTAKSVAHGVSNIDQIIDVSGVANDGNTTIPLPFIHENTAISGIKITADRTNVNVGASRDWSSYGQSYITILYTKR